MKKEDQIVTILAALTAAAPLCACAFWLLELRRDGIDALRVGGAVVSLAGAVLVAVLLTAFRRRQAADWKEQDEALEELGQIHERKIEQVRSAGQEELEGFRSSLSHSLRMPIAIIQGYAELLEGNVVTSPEVRKEYLEKIVQRSQYMSDVMSRHFSAEETIDSSKLSCGALDLLELVRRAAADIQTAAAEQGVAIQVVSQEERVSMTADAYLLNRAIFNLLENALKYMGRPGVVTIRVLQQKDQVSVLVQDDGMGLPPEETVHIFEPHFQGSNRAGGSGYGLHLVKQAAEAHGGTVAAQSALGRGMRITLTLPLCQKGENVSA